MYFNPIQDLQLDHFLAVAVRLQQLLVQVVSSAVDGGAKLEDVDILLEDVRASLKQETAVNYVLAETRNYGNVGPSTKKYVKERITSPVLSELESKILATIKGKGYTLGSTGISYHYKAEERAGTWRVEESLQSAPKIKEDRTMLFSVINASFLSAPSLHVAPASTKKAQAA